MSAGPAGSGAPRVNAAAAAAGGPAYPLAPEHSTLDRTLVHGAPTPTGYRRVVEGPGEPSLIRPTLLGGRPRRPGSERTPLISFGQLSDLHVIDAQSPARVEFLDRINDPDCPFAAEAPFSGAYRPQEMLTAHVAEAMVQALNGLTGAPVTGRALDFTVSTGDNADTMQYNEIRWHVDLLDGHTLVRPDSGDLEHWDGVGGPTDPDPSYWHPDGTPAGATPDHAHARYGFPTVPGLLERCRAAFRATGLRTPWYTVFGNHDALAQGTVATNAAIRAIAVGDLKVTGLPVGTDIAALLGELATDPSAFAALLSSGPVRKVPADPRRRMIAPQDVIAEYFNTTGTPVGHGYTQHNRQTGTGYYSFTDNGVHFIALDTVNRNGYDDGSLDSEQFSWLQLELAAHSSRHLGPSGRWVRGPGNDELIVIFSHHTVDTMENVLGPGRVNGTTVATTLLRFPNVIAWVNGHTHENSIRPYARGAGAAAGAGFWEINTASHVDWPQQARVVEIVDNGDGTLSLFATMIDHCAPTSSGARPTSPLQLAALSRELGLNDWQRPPETPTLDGQRGTRADRNVELLVRAPF